MTESFRDKLTARIKEVDSLLCIGLDPHQSELYPSTDAWNQASNEDKAAAAFTFCKTLIDATLSTAVCYKPNAAFFEAMGAPGIDALHRVIREIPPTIPVLLDAKRGDIGSTASAYAEAAYQQAQASAVTLSPLMGWDSVAPFVEGPYANKGAFLLCKTSNPGSEDILALPLANGRTVYEHIASLIGSDWSARTTALLGLVVGATDAGALAQARAAGGDDVWILAPGVGAQGGNLAEALAAGLNGQGTGMLIPVSRGISRAADPQAAAEDLCARIRVVREQVRTAKAEAATKTVGGDVIADYQRAFLEFALEQGVLRFGSFVLKSGRTSPYFFNAGLFASGAALHKLGKAYAQSIMASKTLADGPAKIHFDVVFGPAYKGISLGAVVAAALYADFGVNVGFAYNRKEAKSHGEGGTLVGADMKGQRILIVDDVITAGTAIRESYDMLTSMGAQPMGVVIALDRAEVRSLDDRVSAVQAVERDLSLQVVSIVNLPQLQSFLVDNPKYSAETLASVKAYREEFGV